MELIARQSNIFVCLFTHPIPSLLCSIILGRNGIEELTTFYDLYRDGGWGGHLKFVWIPNITSNYFFGLLSPFMSDVGSSVVYSFWFLLWKLKGPDFLSPSSGTYSWLICHSLDGKGSLNPEHVILDRRSIWGHSLITVGEGNGNPLQYSCCENPMDRRAWQATVHGVAKSQTWLSMHTAGWGVVAFIMVLLCCSNSPYSGIVTMKPTS